MKRRGRAEVKYQCQGLVPHADAPGPASGGKMLDMKASYSGHSGADDCQKKVSIVTVSKRPAIPPDKAAGMKVDRMSANLASIVGALMSRKMP